MDIGCTVIAILYGMRRVVKVPLSRQSIGASKTLQFHHFGPDGGETAYIQTSLHADEIPGLLVCNHLIRLLDAAEARGDLLKKIIIVPYANPIGLSGHLLGTAIGRFALSSGVNFNRDWIDVTKTVAEQLEGRLSKDNAAENVKLIRELILSEAEKLNFNREDANMKKELFKVASQADIVLDLHCDSEAVLHMYTHDRLWPSFSDLAAELGSNVHLLSANSGGNAFDESVSCPWSTLADKFPGYPIPMACHSATVELRGQLDVNDALAGSDALNLYHFLQGRGYIKQSPADLQRVRPALKRDASPLDGTDMIEIAHAGVLTWKVKPGDTVEAGQLLGEIVLIEDPYADRVPILARNSGFVFGMWKEKLARPGEIVIYVAGNQQLNWRVGNLLTA